MARCITVISLVMLGGASCAGPVAAQTLRGTQPPAGGPATSAPVGSASVPLDSSPPLYGGPPGATVGRYQPRLLTPPAIEFGPAGTGFGLPPALPGREVPLMPPSRAGDEAPPSYLEGPDEGITLDEAIGLLCRNNLELRTRFSEVAQARSDVVTAGLRTNPILFAGVQHVPYGSFSSGAAGGPIEYDVNVVYPLDWSHKRQARTRSATVALQIIEANYRNSVRLTIDNLYQAYIDALVAQATYDRATGRREDNFFKNVPVEEPASALWDTRRTLAVLLNLPLAEVARRQLRGQLEFDPETESWPSAPELVRTALENRPDLAVGRLSVALADVNVRAVLANRWDDVLLLYQPYTFSDGRPDQKNGLGWALGATVPLPIYNRQQGNLQKARQIAEQARTKLASLEQGVTSEVQGAVLEHEAAHQALVRTWNDVQKFNRPLGQQFIDTRTLALDPLAQEEDRTARTANERPLLGITVGQAEKVLPDHRPAPPQHPPPEYRDGDRHRAMTPRRSRANDRLGKGS